MVTRSAFAAVFAVAFGSAACVAVLGLDKLSEKADTDIPDGESPLETGSPEAGTCVVDDIGLPPRPTGPSGDGVSRLFAFSELDFELDASAPILGYDLDHRTTTDLASGSCAFSTINPARVEQYAFDGERGADNAGLGLFKLLDNYVESLTPQNLNARLVDGRFGLVIRLEQWNGTPNDDSVTVYFVPSIGLALPTGDGGFVPRVPGPRDAQASDLWTRDESYTAGPHGSRLVSSRAWVRDGVLVAQFDRLPIPVRISNDDPFRFEIILHDAWITGALTTTALKDALVLGREKASEILAGARLLKAFTANSYFCQAPFEFATIRDMVCAVRDIRASHCEDGIGLPCDALSFGFRFQTYAVDALGPVDSVEAGAYEDAGFLPPEQRCSGPNDVDGSTDCP